MVGLDGQHLWVAEIDDPDGIRVVYPDPTTPAARCQP